jgi:membrane protease YdiL (CAAX protease family)
MPPLFDPSIQPRVDAVIQAVLYALPIAGGVATLGWIICLIRARRIRQPLADTPLTGGGPGLLHLGLVMVGFVLLQELGLAAMVNRHESLRQTIHVPGSNAQHIAMTVDSAAKLIGCIAIILILARRPAFGAPPVRLRPRRRGSALPRAATVVVVATLIVIACTTLQLGMGQAFWNWLHPDAPPPMHPTLIALRSSAWGFWGVVQLSVVALVVAPIAEEFFFRGLMLETLTRCTGSAWIGIALSAVAFGMIHGQPQDKLPLMSMGLILGYVRVRWGGLERCMVIHALFNARTIDVALMAPHLLEAT